MAKIINVSNNTISVGMDDGTFFEVGFEEIDFIPLVGDEVSVYVSGDERIVSKIDSTKKVVQQQNCPNCGAPCQPNQMFCGKCGKQLIQSKQIENSQPSISTPSIPEPIQQNQNLTEQKSPSLEDDSDRLRSITAVLAFFTGFLGLHCFYTGKFEEGIKRVALFLTFIIFVITTVNKLFNLVDNLGLFGSSLFTVICLFFMLFALTFIYQSLKDVGLILIGQYKDGKGRYIKQW